MVTGSGLKQHAQGSGLGRGCSEGALPLPCMCQEPGLLFSLGLDRRPQERKMRMRQRTNLRCSGALVQAGFPQVEPQGCRRSRVWGAGIPAPLLTTLTCQGQERRTGRREHGAPLLVQNMEPRSRDPGCELWSSTLIPASTDCPWTFT